MKNVKQVSRLTGSLLARKGAAAPTRANLSMNKQALDRFSHLEVDKPVTRDREQAKAAAQTREDEQNITPRKSHKRIAMTLRMEEDDHLRLKLHSAYTRKSCQMILSEALDLYIEENNDKIQKIKMASQK